MANAIDNRCVGDLVTTGKIDAGVPGSGSGLDVGEGGSYQREGNVDTGAVILKAFTYDASAVSGSRFTEIADLNANNTLLGDAGDRLYIGCKYKFWRLRCEIGIAKVGGTQLVKFWNGSAITNCPGLGGMVIRKDTADSIGNVWLQQTVEKEYIVQDKDIDSTWATADNQLDAIPNTGTAIFWMCYEVPGGGWSTPPRIDELNIAGSDFDIISGAAFPVFWGKARVAVHERIDLGEGSGAQTATLDLTSTQQFIVKRLRSAQTDTVSRLFQLPQGIDTSCGIEITLDYAADQAITTADIVLDIYRISEGTAIDIGQTSNLVVTTAITVVAGDITYLDQALVTTLLDASTLMGGDGLAIQLGRSDSNGGDFYPLTLTIHLVKWTEGEHV